MEVTITKLRQDLFRLVERALEGEPVQFTHKGVVFRIAPEKPAEKLSRLTRQKIVAQAGEAGEGGGEPLKQVEAEWQKDWAEL